MGTQVPTLPGIWGPGVPNLGGPHFTIVTTYHFYASAVLSGRDAASAHLET